MPPKPKFTREEIAAAAFAMIKEGGVSALTARDLGARMGTSARPIFTLFKNMEDVKQAARSLAVKEFMEYISDYQEYTPAFKRIGMMIVSYGIHEPELFKLLFLQEHPRGVSFEESLKDLDGMDETCIQLVMRDYGLTEADARLLFEQMWTHALGLGTMCAMGVCDFTEEEIGKRQGVMFASLIMFI
ncbi:MAG: TetR/AcrR family transcriptional regulator, partial [Faecousia sp.]